MDRLDHKMLDGMLKKYDTSEDDDMQIVEHKAEDGEGNFKIDPEEEGEVSRDICLPSIKDSKLWRIKVLPGKERELVAKITNKLIEYLNFGNPLNVLEVFECQLSPGIIYCEAYKS